MSCFSLAGAFLARGIHLPDVPRDETSELSLWPLSLLIGETGPCTQSKRLVSPCVASLPRLPRGSKPETRDTNLPMSVLCYVAAKIWEPRGLHATGLQHDVRPVWRQERNAACFGPWLDAIAKSPTHSFGGRHCFDAETFYGAAIPDRTAACFQNVRHPGVRNLLPVELGLNRVEEACT